MRTTTLTRLDVEQDAPMVVYRIVGRTSGQQLAWATLTMQSPGQAFANVCIDDGLPPRDRRRFVDAIVAAVCGLGARQILLVVPQRDLILLEHVRLRCAVLTVAPVGQTSLIRADLADPKVSASQVSPAPSGTYPGALEIFLESGLPPR
ncbi:MAG: hypothetical protein ABI083_12900 [Lapillicoccus sp.]